MLNAKSLLESPKFAGSRLLWAAEFRVEVIVPPERSLILRY